MLLSHVTMHFCSYHMLKVTLPRIPCANVRAEFPPSPWPLLSHDNTCTYVSLIPLSLYLNMHIIMTLVSQREVFYNFTMSKA